VTELDMTADVETEDFTDELTDEALDRGEAPSYGCSTGSGSWRAGS
jgi:hypothetical protein